MPPEICFNPPHKLGVWLSAHTYYRCHNMRLSTFATASFLRSGCKWGHFLWQTHIWNIPIDKYQWYFYFSLTWYKGQTDSLYMPVWTNWPALYKLPVCSNFKFCPPLAISLIEPGPRDTSFWILIHINPIISIVTFLLTTFLQTVSQFVKTLLKSSSSALFQLSAFSAP